MIYKNYKETREALSELLAAKDLRALKELFKEVNIVDLAEFISEQDDHNTGILFRLLPKDIAAEVFSHMDQDAQSNLLAAYTDQEIEEIVDGLFNDDLADIVEEIPASVAKRLLAKTDSERRSLINRLLQYPEESAGAMMTTEYMRLTQNMTVAQAIQKLRDSDKIETIYTCYVTTEDRILEGVITVREILTAKDEEILKDLMNTNVISAQTTEDQETACRKVDRYDLLALPVVDNESRLVGIITFDDALDVLSAESSEDVALLSAVNPTEDPYLQTSVWDNSKRRVVWLLVLMISGMINGSILANFEHAFVALPILVTFIPMLTDTGGNAGSQSSGVLVRAIALGEAQVKDIFKILWRELRIGLLVGSVLAFVNAVRVYFLSGRDLMVALTVSFALYGAVIVAKLVGGSLPLLAHAAGLDPALVAAPFITTLVDAVTLILYFNIAHLLLGI